MSPGRRQALLEPSYARVLCARCPNRVANVLSARETAALKAQLGRLVRVTDGADHSSHPAYRASVGQPRQPATVSGLSARPLPSDRESRRAEVTIKNMPATVKMTSNGIGLPTAQSARSSTAATTPLMAVSPLHQTLSHYPIDGAPWKPGTRWNPWRRSALIALGRRDCFKPSLAGCLRRRARVLRGQGGTASIQDLPARRVDGSYGFCEHREGTGHLVLASAT